MYAFDNEKSYFIRQKQFVPFGEGLRIEDGCQT